MNYETYTFRTRNDSLMPGIVILTLETLAIDPAEGATRMSMSLMSGDNKAIACCWHGV